MAIPSDDADQHCLFVAKYVRMSSRFPPSLPQRLTNEELAVSLLSIFRPFGAVLSVKASRDHRGRPFGFVEYESGTAAASALAYAPFLALDSRRVRVEPARRQCRLCIRCRLPAEASVEASLEEMRTILKQYVADESFKLSLQGGQDANRTLLEYPEHVIAAIVKFEDPDQARCAYGAWRIGNPDWTLTWINMDRTVFGSNVRNSGLVQLVPGDESYRVSRFSPSLSCLTDAAMHSASPMPQYSSNYEEEMVSLSDNAGANDLLLDEHGISEWLGRTLFVGRLNGQRVTLALLREHFSVHGTIRYLRLYSRGAVGYDGVPLDAYAFIRYVSSASVASAIGTEHGRAWLGQAIKCEHARPAALAVLLGSAREPLIPAISPHLFCYQPMAMPSPLLSRKDKSTRSNWHRAKPPIEASLLQ